MTMWVISGSVYDFEKGYQKAQELEERLVEEFGKTLDQVYSVRKKDASDKHDELIEETKHKNQVIRQQWEDKLKKNKNSMVALGSALIIGLAIYPFIIAGLLSFNTDTFGFLSYLFCNLPAFFAAGGIVFLVLLSQGNKIKKNPPMLISEPRISKYYAPLFYLNLTNKWKHSLGWEDLDKRIYYVENLKGERELMETIVEDYGMIGEGRLIVRLTFFPEDYICLWRVLVNHNLDIDILVIGTAGIWIFESKFLKGRIALNNGSWYRRKEHYESDKDWIGPKIITEDENLESPEDQWLREKEALIHVLRKDQSLSNLQWDTLVKGGVVFTHPDSSLSIDETSQAEVGLIPDWQETITDFFEDADNQELEVLSKEQVFHIADLLLDHSRRLNDDNSRSAVEIAKEAYQKAKFEIVMEIDEFKRDYGISSNQEIEKLAEAMDIQDL